MLEFFEGKCYGNHVSFFQIYIAKQGNITPASLENTQTGQELEVINSICWIQRVRLEDCLVKDWKLESLDVCRSNFISSLESFDTTVMQSCSTKLQLSSKFKNNIMYVLNFTSEVWTYLKKKHSLHIWQVEPTSITSDQILYTENHDHVKQTFFVPRPSYASKINSFRDIPLFQSVIWLWK